MFKQLSAAIFCLGLAACSSVSGQAPAQEKQLFNEACPAERSQMCTYDFNPVCGVSDSGEKKTYSNGCSACANENVAGFTLGECH